jgi:hypothetical protein
MTKERFLGVSFPLSLGAQGWKEGGGCKASAFWGCKQKATARQLRNRGANVRLHVMPSLVKLRPNSFLLPEPSTPQPKCTSIFCQENYASPHCLFIPLLGETAVVAIGCKENIAIQFQNFSVAGVEYFKARGWSHLKMLPPEPRVS